MEDIKEFLRSIGLGKNEAEVYMALIKKGVSSVQDISRETKIHRANVYNAVDNLIDKGIAFAVVKDGHRVFYGREPKVLLNYLKEKELELNSIIKTLEIQNIIQPKKSNVEISKGKFALREALFKLLDLKEAISTYGIPREIHGDIKMIFDSFNRERLKRKIQLKCIHNIEKRDSKINNLAFDMIESCTEAKHLPSKYNSPVTTFVCGNKTILVIWHEDVSIIEIDNGEVAESFRNYFEVLWKAAKIL